MLTTSVLLRGSNMRNTTSFLIALICATVAPLGAQTSTATIVGIARDPSGALVAGAKVEVRNVDTNG